MMGVAELGRVELNVAIAVWALNGNDELYLLRVGGRRWPREDCVTVRQVGEVKVRIRTFPSDTEEVAIKEETPLFALSWFGMSRMLCTSESWECVTKKFVV